MNIQPPARAVHTYVQKLVAGPERVFPLLCPVREADWIEGWSPLRVLCASGDAERDCVFDTGAEPDDAIWYVTRHEPHAGFVEMLKITPGSTACRLSIPLQATANGCDATVAYMHTRLGTPAGEAFVAGFTADFYGEFMRDWEARLNHFLVHGTALSGQRG